MRPAEVGFLLLTENLGNPQRKPLSVARFRQLAQRVTASESKTAARDLTLEDLQQLGYGRQEAEKILSLLSHTQQLDWYLARGKEQDCYPITRVSADYPLAVRKGLGLDAPGCLWAKGDRSLLQTEKIALVGSRQLCANNRKFASEVGKQAALQGYTLVSGNAQGADRTAQEACLEHGGSVIAVVAGRLDRCPLQRNVLYLSESGFDVDFTPARAHSRNRVIHTLGKAVFVAQSTYQKGGTWTGASQNLQHRWSQVFAYADDSFAALQMEQMGAISVNTESLKDIHQLTQLTLQTKLEEIL